MVAPFTGAWIEIDIQHGSQVPPHVAPFTGAWIEILICFLACWYIQVAPFTGAWIEIICEKYHVSEDWRRSLHGSVD